MMRAALVIAAVCACSSAPPERLVEHSLAELRELCESTPLSDARRCAPAPGTSFCVYLYPPNSCSEIMLMLPIDCAATPDDYMACARAGCSNYQDLCAVFESCGIVVYRGEATSCN